jgi:DNA polymerase III epsilon subunit-like protein
MTCLLFDTETTGLPLYGAAHPANAPYQPRLCSLGMRYIHDDGALLEEYHALIKPEGWPLTDPKFIENMEQARIKAHGLTFEQLMDEGRPIREVHEVWRAYYHVANTVGGFNLWFDHKIARGEWRRLGDDIPFRHKEGIEIMRLAAPLCGKNVRVSLKDACAILLGRERSGAHHAGDDVKDTHDIYLHLYEKGLIKSELQPEAKKKPEAAAS